MMLGTLLHGENVDPQFVQAAQGSLDAQRAMVGKNFSIILEGAGDTYDLLVLAEFWGRLAACHGDESDIFALGGILAHRSEAELERGRVAYADALSGEMLALLSSLAGAGNERAADMLNVAAECVERRAMLIAKAFAGVWKQ